MDKTLMKKFKDAQKQLNSDQRQAVDAIEGPVMVVAGPGTGKTHLLTMRIANILIRTDTPPEAILALTFTDSGAVSMRKKLSGLIGADAYRIKISTFHNFANEVIRNYADEFPEIIGSVNITDIDQVQILRRIIDKTDLKFLRPFGNRYFYLRSIINAIDELKKQGVSPDGFRQIAVEEKKAFLAEKDLYHKTGSHKGKMRGKHLETQKHISRNEELAEIYVNYQKALKASSFYDYSDMIMQVMTALERSEDLLLTLQEKYLYVLVDEHQDTNSAQNRILELLCGYHKNPNLFIVGDEKQAIFRFQGASLENFLYFKNLYKNVKLISLKNNYRSTQTILDAAYSLNPRSGRLKSEAGLRESLVKIRVAFSAEEEKQILSASIKNLLQKGVSPDQIAVLYRENRDAFLITEALEKYGISFTVESDQDVLSDEDIKKLLIVMKAVQNFGSAPELINMLHLDIFKIPPLDIYKLTNLSKQRINIYDAIRSSKIMREAGIEEAEKLEDIYRKLSFWKIGARNKRAAKTLEDIMRESGFMEYILTKPAVAEKLEKVRALFDQIRSLVESHKDYTLEDFFGYLDVVAEHNVLVGAKNLGHFPGRVRLMTAHKAKGLEFEHVFIFNAVEGIWGGRRNYDHIKLPGRVYSLLRKAEERFSDASDEDERNLFYVALTRAKKQVQISYASLDRNGRERLPCQFVAEIKKELVDSSSAEGERKTVKFAESFAPVIVSSTLKEKEFLSQLFYRQGFSVTALNNYLECPWKYFYLNLIRVPEAPAKHLMFGTAVHEALKAYFNKIKEGTDPGKKYLIDRFSQAIKIQPIQENEYHETLERGKKALSGFYDHYRGSWGSCVLTEVSVNGIELVPGVECNGKLDKIDILDTENKVNVVDFKTGRPKSRNEISGATKNSRGNEKRQLIFYKLLLDNWQNGKYKMISGEINFIEPDPRGKYKKEVFEISRDETEALTEIIEKTAKEIASLSFWKRNCGDPKCPYCGMRKLVDNKL